MGIYVYCLGPGAHSTPGSVRGVDGAPVRIERIAGLDAWVSDLARPPSPSLDGVRAHNTVVLAATETTTPLPFRFGQWFESPAALARSLDERRERLDRARIHIDGALEYGVRVLDADHLHDPDTRPDRTSGRAYLESLAVRARQDTADRARGLEVAAALRAHLGALVRDERVQPGGAGTLAAIAHLVARHDTGEYRATIMNFADEHAELRIIGTGPWPPYGFVE